MNVTKEEIQSFIEINKAQADATAKRSREWYDEKLGIVSKVEVMTILSHLKLTKKDYVLDAGCGAGRITLAMAPLVNTVIGVDHSRECCMELNREATKRGLRNVGAIPIGVNNIEPSGHLLYTKATAIGVIQHLPSEMLRLGALNRIRRSLVKGGLFVSSHYRWGGIIDRDTPQDNVEASGYYRHAFTPDEVRDLMYVAGFKKVRVFGCVNMKEKVMKMMSKMDVFLSHVPIPTYWEGWGRYLLVEARV